MRNDIGLIKLTGGFENDRKLFESKEVFRVYDQLFHKCELVGNFIQVETFCFQFIIKV